MATGDPSLLRTIDDRVVPVAGRWTVNPLHTYVGLTVSHLLTPVHARFRAFSGEIVIADDPLASTVAVDIDAGSLDTGDPKVTEAAVGSFLMDAATHPRITFRSTSVEPAGDAWLVRGELSMRGHVVPVDLATTFNGAARNPFGGAVKMGLSATGSLQREGVGIDAALPVADAPGVFVVGSTIGIVLEVEADLQ